MADVEVNGGSHEGNGFLPELASPAITISKDILHNYLFRLLEITLGAAPQDLETAGGLLSPDYFEDTYHGCVRFLSSNQTVIFIQKRLAGISQANGNALAQDNPSAEPRYTYFLSSDFPVSLETIASVAILKRPQPVDVTLLLSQQLHVLNLPGFAATDRQQGHEQTAGSPFQHIHSVVHSALAPYFDALSKRQDAPATSTSFDNDQRLGIPGAKKKLAEFELSLLQLQQNAEIPQLLINPHAVIMEAIGLAVKEHRSATLDDLPRGLIEDSSFHNSLQSLASQWIAALKNLINTERDPAAGTASQEIQFWLDMESTLRDVDTQLSKPGVLLTIDVLKASKRFMAKYSLGSDTGLKEKIEQVQKYNILMHDFPLGDLLAATSLEKARDATEAIFVHINKKLRPSTYPPDRAVPLVEAISADLDRKMQQLLGGRSMVQLSYADFQVVLARAAEVWAVWNDQQREFITVARELSRKKNKGFVLIKVQPRHTQTQERLEYFGNFRRSHEQFLLTIKNVLWSDSSAPTGSNQAKSTDVDELREFDAVAEVEEAYLTLREVDVLDVTPEGTSTWDRAETTYNERTARVENSLIAQLRDQLATARTATQMFHVFSQFNALFVRPKIRGAISEYQTQLINSVKSDLVSLQNRYLQKYGSTKASAMAQLRDIPPVSGAIIWTRQIESQLNGYMKQVEDVLGADWQLHAEGQKLREDSDNFRSKLDTRKIFDEWLQDTKRRNLAVSGFLFSISSNRSKGNALELTVNYDGHIITLFKEVRNLQWLNCAVPHAIMNASKDARRVYPYAVSLIETLRLLQQVDSAIETLSGSAHLLNGYRQTTLSLIAKGIPLRWQSFIDAYELHAGQQGAKDAAQSGPSSRHDTKHVQYVRDLGHAVSTLQSKTSALSAVFESVQQAINRLKTCSYTFESFERELDIIQNSADRLSLEGYANLNRWVEDTNSSIEIILRERLTLALAQWAEAFASSEREVAPAHQRTASIIDVQEGNTPRFSMSVHEISIRNQTVYLEPPLEHARSSWVLHLQDWLRNLCDQKRVLASRFDHNSTRPHTLQSRQFTGLLTLCTPQIAAVYSSIDEKLNEVREYVNIWLQFQSLWDLQASQVYDTLGNDLARWLELLQDIQETRSTFDNNASRQSFGYLVVDYEQAQSKINAKYDAWQNEILLQFAERLGGRLAEVLTDMQQTRKDLENSSLESSSTSKAVAFISIVQSAKRKAADWELELEVLRQGHTLIKRQRVQLPANWIDFNRVSDEWEALKEILERKNKVVSDQTDALRAKILSEDKVVSQKIADIAAQWKEDRPSAGSIPAEEALKTLHDFESRMTKLNEESTMLVKAKDALELQSSTDNTLIGLLEEVYDFKSVWAALSTVWDALSSLREMLWTSMQPRKLRKSLEDLISMSKDMPPRMRHYAAFEYLQNTVRQLLKINNILAELRSDAMRERHWIQIFKVLKPSKRYSPTAMTLGEVWDLHIGVNESTIRDIIVQAQGELALEEYLRQVRETWQNYSLDLVNYQSKCKLIRGWDELFSKCSDHLNSLQAMRHSPYYKHFEDDASAWEDRLNRVYVLFDVWIDVQRQWVYLEGVFSGNADIKHLLPVESSRFQNINSEFFAVMKKVQRSPFVLEVLGISGVQKSLERLLDLLNKIQKALGEYLERERASFPRFYFVGDEDLLEIIGNSNDAARIARHLGKMFAGIAGLSIDESATIIGFRSAQGEEVHLKDGISLTKTPKVNEWLTALELNMKTTLAGLLMEAVESFSAVVVGGEVNADALQSYLAAYPTQVVVLGAQVWFTSATERSLNQSLSSLKELHELHITFLAHLAELVVSDMDIIQRKKCENLITEFVHQRDIIGSLTDHKADSAQHYLWLLQLRFVYQSSGDPIHRLHIKMANASIEYGFEYLGVMDRLVRTPLTERCFLTMTQALCQRLGGSPYGPAGTGKTETVKALGLQLGRFTLVFCCDDTFDFQAMGRIFLGICQVGAWGCFDEFNRLEERILSAVSQQIQNIQQGLKRAAIDPSTQIDLAGRQVRVNPDTGIFITMNPGYAGRSNLPDNLKKLFRSVAMSKPDKELIAEVTLFSQGFTNARDISRHIVPFFDECNARLSRQPHYDFGLRALKSVLISSGGLKRAMF